MTQSRSKCSKELYCSFLQVAVDRYSALGLSEVAPRELSHDSISRWLQEVTIRPRDIWEAVSAEVLASHDGVAVIDDTVADKNRSQKIELTAWQYSGTVHEVVRGIGIVNLLFSGADGEYTPIDYRIWHPSTDGKTKNDHFREMLGAMVKRKVPVHTVVGDTWYSSLDNLKSIRSHGLDWCMGLAKNRLVNHRERLDTLDIPEAGLKVHLRGYGWITVFRFVSTERRTDYIGTSLENPTRGQVEQLMKRRWKIEVFHRELKQTCGIQACQSRTARAQRNHIGLSMLAWIHRNRRRQREGLTMYRMKWDVIAPAIHHELVAMSSSP